MARYRCASRTVRGIDNTLLYVHFIFIGYCVVTRVRA